MMNHDINLMKKMQSEKGLKWFKKDTMNYWGTEIITRPKRNFFISSEENFNYHDQKSKTYSIRFFNPKTYRIVTVKINNNIKFNNLQFVRNNLNEILNKFDIELLDNEKINNTFDRILNINYINNEYIGLEYINNNREVKKWILN